MIKAAPQFSLFDAPPAAAGRPAAPPPPADAGDAPIDPVAALAGLTVLTALGDDRVVVGAVGWDHAARVYYRLLRQWEGQGSAVRSPLPGAEGIVLSHLHRLTIFCTDWRADGTRVVPAHLIADAHTAARQLQQHG